MSNNAIEICNLTFGYTQKEVFQQLSLSFAEGDFCAMIGPNGSGKTTLLKAIAGILSPKVESNVLIYNKLIKNYSRNALAKKLAFVAQRQEVVFDFSVFDTVMMGRNPYQKRWDSGSKNDEDIVTNVLQQTRLWHLRDRMLAHLSGGEMQRVMIARAMAQQTPILLLDEPLANLDIAHKFEIMDILKELNQTNHTTILIILHDFSFAKQYTDKTLLLNEGKVELFAESSSVITTSHIQQVFNLSTEYQVDEWGNIRREGR